MRPCLDDMALLGLVTGTTGASRTSADEHLAECAACRGAVAILLRGGATRSGTRDPLFPVQLAPGTRIGRYEVRAWLGAGGMGVVYAARDPKLDRTVALKIVRGARPGTRTLREAQAMARLAHPNVVAVHDVLTQDDELVIVLELVPGLTLAQWLLRPRTWREIVDAFTQAARGLDAAHVAGLVHRDFKPSNVFVRDDGGRVQVGDFGLARLVEAADRRGRHDPGAAPSDAAPSGANGRDTSEASPLAKVTRDGALVGTPHYMAPEQKAGTADERSDQYAFAVALREALASATAEPQPAGLADLVARASAPAPADRFPSMARVAEALEALADPSRDGASPTARRRIALAVAGALASAAAVYAFTRPRAESPPPPPEHVVAMLPFADHTRQTELDFTHAGLPRLLGTELQRAGLRVIGTYELRDRAAQPPPNDDVPAWRELAASLGADLAVSGTLASEGGEVVVSFALTRVDGQQLGAWTVRGAPSKIPDLVGTHAGQVVAATGRVAAAPNAPRDFAVERDLSLAIDAFQQLQLGTARKLLDAVLAREPRRAEALYHAALLAWWENEAAHVFQAAGERALAADLLPEQRGVIAALAALVAGERDRAVEQLRRLEEQFPTSTHVRYLLSEALFHGGYPAEGITVYRQLAELAPRWHLALQHPLTYYAVRGDDAGMQWALARLPLLDAPTAAVWRHRHRILRGDHRGPFTALLAERDAARARGEPFLAEIDLAVLAMALDEEATLDATTRGLDVVKLALALRHRDREAAGAAFDAMVAAPTTDRQRRYTITHALPLVLAAGDAVLAERALRLLDAAIAAHPPSIDEQLGRLYLRTLLGDRAAIAAASSSPIPEVVTVARALAANAAGAPEPALWRRAFELSSDGLFVIPGRLQLAGAPAAAPADVVEACAPILRPHHVDLAIGVAITPCLALTARAREALGQRTEARALYRRLVDLVPTDADAAAGYARVVFW